jgi:hypothetical protein
MALKVGGAFAEFRRDVVDLDATQTETARRSRDYLHTQLSALSNKDNDFPILTHEFVSFGSFARRTKKRPLDDIDFLMILESSGTEVENSITPYTRRLKLKSTTTSLARYADPAASSWNPDRYINSTRILNAVKRGLMSVPNYDSADARKSYAATVLKLKTYPWTFDIVPAVTVAPYGESIPRLYLIPDGSGNWLETDPRVDQKNATECNQRHVNDYLRVVRLLKYWHKRPTHPSLESYHFETICWQVFRSATLIPDCPRGVADFFLHAPSHVSQPCYDPKGLGPRLDLNLSNDDRRKIIDALSIANMQANRALSAASIGDDRTAIGHWRSIFGDKFPTYC